MHSWKIWPLNKFMHFSFVFLSIKIKQHLLLPADCCYISTLRNVYSATLIMRQPHQSAHNSTK